MNNKITQIAKQVVEAKEANKKFHIVNKINFDLTESGFCYRFVRQVIEAANNFKAVSSIHSIYFNILLFCRQFNYASILSDF